jgi:hypothetical protein
MELLNALKKHFNETSKEELLKGWEALDEFDNVGPSVSELIEKWHSYYSFENERFKTKHESKKIIIETPKYSESFFCNIV